MVLPLSGLKVWMKGYQTPRGGLAIWLRIWKPKARNPYINYTYSTEEEAFKKVRVETRTHLSHLKWVVEKREARKNNPDPDSVTERNKRVKEILSKEFGKENVRVTGGTGTAYGWCKVKIFGGQRLSSEPHYSREESEIIEKITNRAEELLSFVKFYHYYDDMGYSHSELLIEVVLSAQKRAV